MKKVVIILFFLGWCMPAQTRHVVYPHHVYCVILAGGSGERLWPLSRVRLPKQLLVVGSDRTLLDQAIDRVSGLVPSSNIWVSTTQQHADRIADVVGHRIGNIVIEPGSRNTGPAILYCCMELYKHDPHAVVAFLPADPFIPMNAHFADFLEHALDYVCNHDHIALLGLKPRYPATGYGYIEFDKQAQEVSHDGLIPVKKFHEKPSFQVAQDYIAAGNMLWNAGMFCGKAGVFLEEFEKHAPEMFAGVQAFMQGAGRYEDVISDSIDYAIMEKSNRISVLPVDFPWCDVGNVEVFLSIKEQSQQQASNVVSIDAKGNLVDAPGKLVALVGVEDLCIVDTGDTLLVVKRQEAEKVKQVVKALKEMQAHEYL